jgi:hypothetical protein
MAAFAYAMNLDKVKVELDRLVFTENGALTNASTGANIPSVLKESGPLMLSPILDLWFWLVRGFNIKERYNNIDNAFNANAKYFAKLCFQTRDIRGGKGERTLGRELLVNLSNRVPEVFSEYLVKHVPEYGRWDDLIYIAYESKDPIVKDACFNVCSNQLQQDSLDMLDGKPISLCAKWMPNEKSSWTKRYPGCYNELAKHMKISNRALRIQLTTFRMYINVIEQKMCAKNWNEIDYSKVPSQAMLKLKKAFARNDPERFLEFSNALQRGDPDVKVNASTLMPHELVQDYIKMHKSVPYINPITQAQWDTLLRQYKEKSTLDKTLVVADVSASMNGLPMRVSVSLGIFISQLQNTNWKGQVITFHTNPTFCMIPDAPLNTQIDTIISMPWGGSTDIIKTFTLILDNARKNELSCDDMPEQVIIISDMQFNCADRNITNLDMIRTLYNESGYQLPRLVFWNVAGRINDVPARSVDDNIALVSGFSPSILSAIMNADDFSPLSCMLQALDNPRYDKITW